MNEMNSYINIQNNQNSENKASRILFMQSFKTPKVYFFSNAKHAVQPHSHAWE